MIQGALISVVGFLALWGLAFFVSLILAPGKIDAGQEESITKLKATISALSAKPKISAAEQDQRRLVREKMAEFSPAEAEVVRFIFQHSAAVYDRLVEKFGEAVAQTATQKGILSGLVLDRRPRYDLSPVF